MGTLNIRVFLRLMLHVFGLGNSCVTYGLHQLDNFSSQQTG
jgi:hypothetical protein